MNNSKGDFNHQKNVEELLSEACNFQAESEMAREGAREEYRKEEPEQHNSFRMSLDGLMVRTSRQFPTLLMFQKVCKKYFKKVKTYMQTFWSPTTEHTHLIKNS